MLCEPFGKRRAMQIVSVPMFMAWMLFHFASHVNHLYAGLALAGFSGGLMEAPVSNECSKLYSLDYVTLQIQNRMSCQSISGFNLCRRSDSATVPWHVGIHRYYMCDYRNFHPIHSWYIFYVA